MAEYWPSEHDAQVELDDSDLGVSVTTAFNTTQALAWIESRTVPGGATMTITFPEVGTHNGNAISVEAAA